MASCVRSGVDMSSHSCHLYTAVFNVQVHSVPVDSTAAITVAGNNWTKWLSEMLDVNSCEAEAALPLGAAGCSWFVLE